MLVSPLIEKAWRTYLELPFHKLRFLVRVLVKIQYQPPLWSVEDAL